MTRVPDTIDSLLAIPKFGTGLALHRMAALAREVLSSPWGRKLDALHVTGSNGKGSVASMAALTLSQLGFRTGLYVSPHHYRFNERISVNGAPISDSDLARHTARLQAQRLRYYAAHPGDEFGAFEFFTVLALEHFAEQDCEAVVLEAGLGGRYDPTRLVPGPTAALVSVDLEHTKLLGPTLEHIAFDKADLCPEGGELVVGRLDAELERRLEPYLALRRITALHLADALDLQAVAIDSLGMRASLAIGGADFPDLDFALPGRHQIDNAAIAFLMVQRWLLRHAPERVATELPAAFRAAVAQVRWPGRLERVGDDPPFFIDVGHTPAAVAAAADGVRALASGRPIVLLVGISYDKEADGILEVLAGLATIAVCTRAHHKGRNADELAALLRAKRPGLDIRTEADISRAVKLAVGLAEQREAAVFAAGGLFIAIEAATALRGEDPGALRFL